MSRLAAVLAFAALSIGIAHAQIWKEIKKKAQDQINKTTQPSPSANSTSAPNTSTLSGTSTPSSNAQPIKGTDLYHYCMVSPQGKEAMSHIEAFSRVFPAVSPAQLVATVQFAQYIADKYKTPIFFDKVDCSSDPQGTEDFSTKRRQINMDHMKKVGPNVTVVEEDWTFTDRPTMEQAREAGNRMRDEIKIYPAGSGGQAAEDAAVQATPEYKTLVAAEPKKVVSTCEGNEMMSSFYNCACTADMVSRERQKVGGDIAGGNILHPTTDALIAQADLSKCLQPDGAKAYFYRRAMNSTTMLPAEQQKPIAACAADRLLNEIQAKPSTNMALIDNMFANALTACHTGRR